MYEFSSSITSCWGDYVLSQIISIAPYYVFVNRLGVRGELLWLANFPFYFFFFFGLKNPQFFFSIFCLFVNNHSRKLNDFWVFDIVEQQWTWLTGSNIKDIPGDYSGQDKTPGSKIPFFGINPLTLIVNTYNLFI